MTGGVVSINAEDASAIALSAVLSCLNEGRSFVLEAGAGAGKTYSLIKALQHLISRDQHKLFRSNQRVACITFTNVAKHEIEARTDKSPLIFCETTHAFCWSAISGFQKQLREELPKLRYWPELIEEHGSLAGKSITYSLGFRGISDSEATLHHDDVILLMVSLLQYEKFRKLIGQRFPVILIDEYQDTDSGWIEAIKTHFLGKEGGPLFGFFGDHWQKIYGDGCGEIIDTPLKRIGKGANFRSAGAVVDVLNRMRPELPQMIKDGEEKGNVRVFHTNDWTGPRQTGNHWGGDLPSETAHDVLLKLREELTSEGWDFSPETTKVLMLTHRVLASEQGYGSLPSVFRYNEEFAKKENKHIAFFIDVLEPACDAFMKRRYGDMFAAFGTHVPKIKGCSDKVKWSESMETLNKLRVTGTIGEVVDYLRETKLPRLPDSVEHRERELEKWDPESQTETPRVLAELSRLRSVPYAEIISLAQYHNGHSPFETKHGVKGAEFENVLVVLGRGWNQYNFNEMLELAALPEVPLARRAAFERNRNLFYVACSRPKKRLALLFTQRLSTDAIGTLSRWFGDEAIHSAQF